MTAWKSGIAALLLVVGLTSVAQAQGMVRDGRVVRYVGVPANESSLDVYTVYGGYGYYDQPVPYVSLGGSVPPVKVSTGQAQPGPARNLASPKAAPKVSNNLGTLSTAIKAQTSGKPGMSKNGISASRGVPRGRRGL